MDTGLTPIKLKKTQFEMISQLVGRLTGINLHPGKQELVRARLTKRLRALGLKSFDAYMEYLEHDHPEGELAAMVEGMTTNKTNFFREPQHFNYLCRQIVPGLRNRKIRVWSAGCYPQVKNRIPPPSSSMKRSTTTPCGTLGSWRRTCRAI